MDTAARQQKVREGMQWAWKGYREFAWGEDELLPHSHTSHRWFGLGLTLVDSLDTLHVMGLEEELSDAREWVARNLMLDQVGRHHPTPLSGGLCIGENWSSGLCVYAFSWHAVCLLYSYQTSSA